MNLKVVAPLLGIAAIAAVSWNVIALRDVSPVFDESIDLDGADEDADQDGASLRALAPIDALAVARIVSGLPGEDEARSPFLTRAEAEALRRGGARTTGGAAFWLPKLDGILWSPARRVAWLDGQPRVEGDVVAGRRLDRIALTSVTLRDGDTQIHLPLTVAPRDSGSATRADTGSEEAAVPLEMKEAEVHVD